MRRTTFVWVLVFVLFAIAGCGSDAKLGEIIVTDAVTSIGEATQECTTFTAGDSVYVSLELTDAYEGLKVHATWLFNDQTMHEEELSAPRRAEVLDPVFLAFTLHTEPDWPAGTYQCKLFVPDQGNTIVEFTLQESKE